MFEASYNLSDLDSSQGFILNGISEADRSSFSVSGAGDINGDGLGDLIIGAFLADPDGRQSAGQSYVVLGSAAGFPISLDLSTLDGSNGFTLDGLNESDAFGYSVSGAGDINGDGLDDLIIGAHRADPNGRQSAGQSYVVFGSSAGFSANLDLSTLNGENGFVLNGIQEFDTSGNSVSAVGDVNGDGVDDLIVGARGAQPNGLSSGQSYVVFGSQKGFSASVELSDLDGTNGFALNGAQTSDISGYSVSEAGDVNGDGVDDLIIGAAFASPNGQFAGQSYVVFGSADGFPASVELSELDGQNGFSLNGSLKGEESGYSVSSAGDINADGIGDLIIGAPFADAAGKSYVVFGSAAGFPADLELADLDGSNGFTIGGIYPGGAAGFSVSGLGDVNGDEIDDLMVGAPNASPNDLGSSGQSYVVFGSSDGFSANLDLADLNGINGIAFNGISESDASGNAVSGVGDVNGDGINDLIIGASNAAPNGNPRSGQAYVIYGGDFGANPGEPQEIRGTSKDDTLTGTQAEDTIYGFAGDDLLDGTQGDDSLIGGGDRDRFIVRAGAGTDTISDFGGVGVNVKPSSSVIAEFDTLIFSGDGLTAEKMHIVQNGDNLEITFDGVDDTKVILQSFELEDLDNFSAETGASITIGNILFDGQTEIVDNFDVINKDSKQRQVFNRNTVTFLNNLDNNVKGFDKSDDVINGQDGNDTLKGYSGNDLLRGGAGDDRLIGVNHKRKSWVGEIDTLTGGEGQDTFVLGHQKYVFYNDKDPSQSGESDYALLTDFDASQDFIQLKGTAERYQLDFVATGNGTVDAKLSFKVGKMTVGEVIAILQDVSSDLSLSDSAFTFVH